jgi:hypothetical protein
MFGCRHEEESSDNIFIEGGQLGSIGMARKVIEKNGCLVTPMLAGETLEDTLKRLKRMGDLCTRC